MKGLRVTRLALCHVGVLRHHIDFGELDPEITLITGGNEVGKTTTVEALRTVFFERHNAGHAGIRALQPHGTREGPEMWVSFEHGGHEYELHKRFLASPLAELRVDGGTPLTGDQAEEEVRRVLGASEPGVRGAKPSDMGLWGLLWVSQDEAAFVDPGSRLGEETRGALQEAIGRQVGQIVGGAHGEHLRTRVREEAGRYWTPVHGNETGELAQARAERRAAAERVTAISKAIDDVEDIAVRHAGIAARIDEIRRDRPTLEAELDAARRDAAGAEKLRESLEKAVGERRACEARLDAAQQRWDTRRELVGLVEEHAAAVERLTEELAEMQAILAARQERHADAVQARTDAEGLAEAARQGFDEAATALEAARHTTAARRMAADLEGARAAAARLAELRGQQAEVIDEAAWEELRALEETRDALSRKLESEGTRLTFEGLGEPLQLAAGRARSFEVEGVGSCRLVPAGVDLAVARDELRDAESTLAEALRGAGVDSVEAARERRRERTELEVEREQLDSEIADRAPEGLDSLADEVAEGVETLARAERDLREAENAAERQADQRAALDALPVDGDALVRLEDLARKVELAVERHKAIGTGIALRARGDVDVAVDDEAPASLRPGATERWTFTRPTRLVVGELVEIEVTPGGKDVHEVDVRLQRTREALAEALRAHDVASLEEARQSGRAWTDARAALQTATNLLAEKAPRGLDVLRAAVRDGREAHESRARKLKEARALLRRRGEVEQALADNSVTEQVLADLEGQLGARDEARRAAEGLAARAQLPGVDEVVALERRTGELGSGVSWTLVPGEGGAATDAALESADRDLAAALARHGAADLTEAGQRWRRGLTLSEQILKVSETLERLAPEGLEALEAAVAELPPPALDAAEPDVTALEAAVEKARANLTEAEQARDAAREAEGSADRERATFEVAVGGKSVELEQHRTKHVDAIAKLDGTRAETADEELERRVAAATTELQSTRTHEAEAHEAMEAASPELLDGELQRATQALSQSRDEEQKLQNDLAAVRALLDRAAAEGHFEQLGEAEADLAEADRTLRRVERAAVAAKRLLDEVEKAYAEAQARFLAPVVRKARPYLNSIRPGTEIRMSPDLAVDKVVRRGAEEDFKALSGGTREQLSVIVRIALARVLSEDEESAPLPLILDDTMGWTDDGRFLNMVRILRNASKEFQLIVLTCHPDRFARMQPGRTIDLEALRREAEAAGAAHA